VDDIDRILLRTLRHNARASYAELARQVGLSAPAVHDRVDKLETTGVITGYHASIAPSVLGKSVSALIGVFITDNGDSDKIAADLAAQPAVEDCWFVAGEETFVLKASVPDVAGLEALIRTLNAVDGVARTRTTVVLSTKIEDRLH
jgi:Lrp/AsnC family transcriptional regulator, leucine-responsive regulatory protein